MLFFAVNLGDWHGGQSRGHSTVRCRVKAVTAESMEDAKKAVAEPDDAWMLFRGGRTENVAYMTQKEATE